MSLPRYPEYKDSGVEWLGEVPVHWEIRPLKRVTTFNDDVLSEATDGDHELKYVEISDVHADRGITGSTTYLFQDAPSRARRNVRDGDVLVSTVRTYLRAIAPVFSPPDNLVVSTGFAVIRPVHNIVNPGFMGFSLRSQWFVDHIVARSVGVSYPAINATDLVGIHSPIPPIMEQEGIARFLDHETAKIDALIQEQQRLIKLLKEKRQAVISHAVTKGLDPSVPMKDSGIEWLGEVPEHWDRVSVGRVCRQVSDGPHFSPSYVDDGVMFLSARNISVDAWQLDDAKYISEEDYHEFCRRVIPEKGDVLYTKGGTTGVARVVDLEERFQVWVHVAVLKLDRQLVDPWYLAFALNSSACYEQSQLYTRGATNQDLGLTRMIKIWFALPPLGEQEVICEFLNREVSEVDQLVVEARQVIALLTERRSALISAAVTGKIDVRNWQPPTDESAFDEEVRQAGLEVAS